MINQTTDARREEGAKTPYGEALTRAIADGTDEYSFAMGYRTALDIASKQPMPLSEDDLRAIIREWMVNNTLLVESEIADLAYCIATNTPSMEKDGNEKKCQHCGIWSITYNSNLWKCGACDKYNDTLETNTPTINGENDGK